MFESCRAHRRKAPHMGALWPDGVTLDLLGRRVQKMSIRSRNPSVERVEAGSYTSASGRVAVRAVDHRERGALLRASAKSEMAGGDREGRVVCAADRGGGDTRVPPRGWPASSGALGSRGGRDGRHERLEEEEWPPLSLFPGKLLPLTRLHGPDAIQAHHLVVLVLDDVAVPDELAGVGEPQPQPGHLAGVGDDGVLPAALPGLGRVGLPASWTGWMTSPLSRQGEALPVDDLEGDLVDVHRVGVGGGVVELPDLGGAHGGFSLTSSSHFFATRFPARRRCPAGPRRAPSKNADASSSSASGRVVPPWKWRVMAGSSRNCGGVVGSGATAGTTRNCMTWPVCPGRRPAKSTPGTPPPNGSSGPTLPEDVVADRHVGEVDDQVGPFGQAHQQPVAVGGGQVDRRGQEAALVADLPDLDAGDLR